MRAPMRGRRSTLALCALAFLAFGPAAGGGIRDDTDALQAKLDAGGAIFLPKLPAGQGYPTPGLLVSPGDTTITSHGACIVGLGLGPPPVDPTAPQPPLPQAGFPLHPPHNPHP